jgi:hypothetical protein
MSTPSPKPTSPLKLQKAASMPNLHMAECTVTSKTPLIVRAGFELDSPRIGQLRPGRKVTLIKVHAPHASDEEDGVRACVALDVGEPIHRAQAQGIQAMSWRDTYPERPLWWDEVNMNGLHSLHNPQSFRRQVPLGWVTVSKAGRELLTPRTQLHAGARQRHMQAWARRQAVDRSIAATAMAGKKTSDYERDKFKEARKRAPKLETKLDKRMYMNELGSDPNGIGFAYGGVEPGRLHAHGQLVETHKVFYSIGVCGLYRLHIGLRNQALPLPGSPFQLEVLPGPSHALSTFIPKSALPLRGVVGCEEDQGCRLTLPTMDKMGNQCNRGGAKVACHCSNAGVTTQVEDLENGSYILLWQSNDSGSFEVSVTIDNIPVNGSPTTVKLVSGSPDLSKTVIYGTELDNIQAGKLSSFTLKLLDEHENVALAPPSFHFGMTIVRMGDKEEKDRWKKYPSHDFQGEWEDEEYTMNFHLNTAGDSDVYLWCQDTSTQSPRQMLPGSPFKVRSTAGKAHAAGSYVEGFSKVEVVEEKVGKKAAGKAAQGAPPTPMATSTSTAQVTGADGVVGAGEIIMFKPQIRDQFGNPAAATGGALFVDVVSPDGTHEELPVAIQVRGGLTTYEVRYEPIVQGTYLGNFLLSGAPIRGSPVQFKCEAAVPDISRSTVSCPDPPYYANQPTEVVLVAVDKFNNKCTRGGASILARLQAGALPFGQDSSVPVQDKNDGTYIMRVELVAPAEIGLVVMINSDKGDKGGGYSSGGSSGGGELPPIPMTFLSQKAKEKNGKQAAAAALEGGSKTHGKKLPKSGLGQKAGIAAAGKEILSALGGDEERRQKVLPAESVAELALGALGAGQETANARGSPPISPGKASVGASPLGKSGTSSVLGSCDDSALESLPPPTARNAQPSSPATSPKVGLRRKSL